MKYDFTTIMNRKGYNTLAVEAYEMTIGNCKVKEGIEPIPMWVADMDFATPDFIIDAIKARLEHPIFGYTMEPERYRKAIISWIASHHNWQIESDWICYIPGIVKGIAMAMVSLLKAGDKVQLMGFGTFEVKTRAARTTRKPGTDETVEVPERKVPAFKAGKGFKDQF